MVPGEASVETGLGGETSPLQTASNTFCEGAEAQGWVSAGNGLAGLASVLMNGGGEGEREARTYAEQIAAESADPASSVIRIANDAEAARLGLSNVTAEAAAVLADPQGEASRSDVTSYERALVRAQRVARAFTDALDIVSARTSDVEAAAQALSRFNAEIDAARRTADDLAARYASLGETSI